MENSTTTTSIGSRPFLERYRWGIVLLGASLGGITWRLRGDGALGGSIGMFFVGLVFLLFLTLIIRNNEKFSPGFMGIALIFIGLTTGGYGTFIGQLSGRFNITNSLDTIVSIPAYNGWVWLFITGFCWVPLFAMLFGILFSSHCYQLKNIIALVVLYFSIEYFCRLLIGHLLVPIISPETTKIFADSISDPNSNPWLLYIQHFFDRDYLVAISGGRNYGTQVDNISASLAALGVVFYFLLIKKDLIAAKTTFIICFIFGLGMMIAAIWQFIGAGGLYTEGVGYAFTAPDWIRGVQWAQWEFTTGFLSIGATTYFILSVIQKTTPSESNSTNKMIFSKDFDVWLFFIGFLIIGSLAFFQLIGARFEDAMEGKVFEGIMYVIIGVGILIMFIIGRKNLFSKQNHSNIWPSHKQLWKCLIIVVIISVPVYLFLHANGLEYILSIVQYCVLGAGIYSVVFLLFWWKKELSDFPSK